MAPKRIEDLDDARRLQLLVEGIVDYALYTISLDGLVVSWNSGARRLKGYEARRNHRPSVRHVLQR